MKCPICDAEVVKQHYRNAYICEECLKKFQLIIKNYHSDYFDNLLIDYYLLLGCVRKYAKCEDGCGCSSDAGVLARNTLDKLKLKVEEGRAEKDE